MDGGQRQCLYLGLSGSPVQILPHRGDPAQDNHPIYVADHFVPEVRLFTEGMKFSHVPRVGEFNEDKRNIFSVLGNEQEISYVTPPSSDCLPLLIVCIG